jgi:hypothetical protein
MKVRIVGPSLSNREASALQREFPQLEFRHDEGAFELPYCPDNRQDAQHLLTDTIAELPAVQLGKQQSGQIDCFAVNFMTPLAEPDCTARELHFLVHLRQGPNALTTVSESGASLPITAENIDAAAQLLAATFARCLAGLFAMADFIQRCARLHLDESALSCTLFRLEQEAMAARIATVFPDIYISPDRYLLIDATAQQCLAFGVAQQLGGQVAVLTRDWWTNVGCRLKATRCIMPIILTERLYSQRTLAAKQLTLRFPSLFQRRRYLIVAALEGDLADYHPRIVRDSIVQVCCT